MSGLARDRARDRANCVLDFSLLSCQLSWFEPKCTELCELSFSQNVDPLNPPPPPEPVDSQTQLSGPGARRAPGTAQLRSGPTFNFRGSCALNLLTKPCRTLTLSARKLSSGPT